MGQAWGDLPPQQRAQGIGCIIMLVFCIGIGGCLFKAHLSDVSRNNSLDAGMASGHIDHRVSSVGILMENDEDGLGASQKYDDKIVEVSGTIVDVTNTKHTHTVDLGPVMHGYKTVTCHFDESYHTHLASLRKGQSLTVRGVASMGYGIDLYRCRW